MPANGNDEKRVDLVFEGGGVKGIGLAGAVEVLEERGYRHQNLAGASAGAITAALLAVGYSAAELKDVIFNLNYRQFQDRGLEDKIPLVRHPLSLFLDHGIYEGERFLEWMAEMVAAKGKRTFGELVIDETKDDPRFRYKLQVIASDVTTHELLVLPRDAHKIGQDPDELEIALAVRMSMSIPVYFEPVKATDEEGVTHTIVDGGMLSNFPVWLFDCGADAEPDWPTFGLLLVEPDPKTSLAERLDAADPPPTTDDEDGVVTSFLHYVKSLAQTMMEAHDRLYVEKAEYARTIPIPTLGVRTTEFELTQERAQALYESGRKAAEDFLADWDFRAYIEEFRRGKEHSRRRDVVEEMRRAPVG